MAAESARATDPLSDTESTGSSRDDEGWDDVEADEEESQEIISLLDDQVFPDILSMLAHCKDKHGFDFLAVRQRLGLDFHGSVRLVNYIRQRVHSGLPVTEDIQLADVNQDQYLKPVLDDDAVILSLFDLPEVSTAGSEAVVSSDNPELVADLRRHNNELEEQLARVTAQFENYRVAVQKTLDERWGEPDQAGSGKDKGKAFEMPKDDSQHYWESYAGADIHETMLKDAVRTDAYRDFIYNNKHLFAGKTVLDIGCGTGILSMFCARAGASRVIAVDASAIISKARENVFHNGLSSTITCLSGRIEEVNLPVDSVDIIVSEWMGYCLLFEAMLPSVLWARDRYLKPDGLLVPSHTNIWLAPVADPQYIADNVSFWCDIYGFDMGAMQTGIYEDVRVLCWPDPAAVKSESDATLVGKPSGFKLLDLYTVTEADLSFTSPFHTTLYQDIDSLDGFLVWFDTFFSPTRGDHASSVTADSVADEWAKADPQNRVAFTTGPWGIDTHWKQGLLICDPRVSQSSSMKKGEEVAGEITFAPPEDNPRGLELKMTWRGKDTTDGKKAAVQNWLLR